MLLYPVFIFCIYCPTAVPTNSPTNNPGNGAERPIGKDYFKSCSTSYNEIMYMVLLITEYVSRLLLLTLFHCFIVIGVVGTTVLSVLLLIGLTLV